MRIAAQAVFAPKSALQPFAYDAEVGEQEVLIRVTHCGICHSDLHLIDDDWGRTPYPLVPGHEVIGIVERCGPGVRGLEPGQRVGVGWQCGACFACESCEAGHENACRKLQATCRGHFGGFAERLVVDARFAFSLPEALPSAEAAPLMCAGTTVYAALRRGQAGPGVRVGVVGLGGLGHLGVAFGRALGAELAVLSSTMTKADDARALGASRFVTDPGELRRSLDLLLVTVPVDLPWKAYLDTLRPFGRVAFVGAPPSPLSIPIGLLIDRQIGVFGSLIGSRATITEMLKLAADAGVRPWIERMPMARAQQALERVRTRQVRHRMVLEAE
ncbi:MAG: NAD(P)-dependent alcohol dehydrogenase [Enhygromyxa sp.]